MEVWCGALKPTNEQIDGLDDRMQAIEARIASIEESMKTTSEQIAEQQQHLEAELDELEVLRDRVSRSTEAIAGAGDEMRELLVAHQRAVVVITLDESHVVERADGTFVFDLPTEYSTFPRVVEISLNSADSVRVPFSRYFVAPSGGNLRLTVVSKEAERFEAFLFEGRLILEVHLQLPPGEGFPE